MMCGGEEGISLGFLKLVCLLCGWLFITSNADRSLLDYSSRRGFPVNAAPSADEEVALSVRCAARYT